MNKTLMIAAVLLSSAVALAGQTYSNASSDVELTDHSGGGGYAMGSIGAVRNSPDGVQYIGCLVRTPLSGTEYASCYARDASYRYRSCSTSNWRLVDAIQSIEDSTRLRFSWDASYQCTEIETRDASTEEPRQL